MKIAVVGVGAMGSVYSGLLGSAGNEVWAVDVWTEHVEAIRSAGLRLEGASGDRVVHINATTDATEVGAAELVAIATKAMDVEAAARAARHLLDPETLVLTMQNGVGSAERVASILGANRVVIGVAGGFGASIVAPGHAHHHGLELLQFAELVGPSTPRIDRIAEVWRGAGFKVRTCDDAGPLIWEKLICNVGFSGTCALLELTIGGVLANPDAWWVAAQCAEEAVAVARARGISLEVGDVASYVRAFGMRIPGARPSMLLDLLAGRHCEIDVINGAIPALAREVGLQAPINETVTALIKAKESRVLATGSATGLSAEATERPSVGHERVSDPGIE